MRSAPSNDWMEPDQVEEGVRRLCDFQSPSLIENNKQVLKWITEGTGVTENRKTGEPSPTVQIVDYENRRNDWMAVCQFKARIPGREQHIISDVVLFLNDLPVVVFEARARRSRNPSRKRFTSSCATGSRAVRAGRATRHCSTTTSSS
jgi:type I restriction enzyme, R subunit